MNEKDLPELPENCRWQVNPDELFLQFAPLVPGNFINTAFFRDGMLHKFKKDYKVFADDISEEDAVAIMAQWAWMGELE